MKIAWLAQQTRSALPQLDSLIEYLYQMLSYNGFPCIRLQNCSGLAELFPTEAELSAQRKRQRRFVCLALTTATTNGTADSSPQQEIYRNYVEWRMRASPTAPAESDIHFVILNIKIDGNNIDCRPPETTAQPPINRAVRLSPDFKVIEMDAAPSEIPERLSELLTDHMQFRWLELFNIRFLYPITTESQTTCMMELPDGNHQSVLMPLDDYLNHFHPFHQCVWSVALAPAENAALKTPFAEVMSDNHSSPMILVWPQSMADTMAEDNSCPAAAPKLFSSTDNAFSAVSFILLYKENRLLLCRMAHSKTASLLFRLSSNELCRPRLPRLFRQNEFEELIETSMLTAPSSEVLPSGGGGATSEICRWYNQPKDILLATTEYFPVSQQETVLFDPAQVELLPVANSLNVAFTKPSLSVDEISDLKQMIYRISYAADTTDPLYFPQHRGDKEKTRHDYDKLRSDLHAFVQRQRQSGTLSPYHEDVCRYISTQVRQLNATISRSAAASKSSSASATAASMDSTAGNRQYKPWLECCQTGWNQTNTTGAVLDSTMREVHADKPISSSSGREDFPPVATSLPPVANNPGLPVMPKYLRDLYATKRVDSYRLDFRPAGWKSPFADEIVSQFSRGDKLVKAAGKRKRAPEIVRLGTGMDMVEF